MIKNITDTLLSFEKVKQLYQNYKFHYHFNHIHVIANDFANDLVETHKIDKQQKKFKSHQEKLVILLLKIKNNSPNWSERYREITSNFNNWFKEDYLGQAERVYKKYKIKGMTSIHKGHQGMDFFKLINPDYIPIPKDNSWMFTQQTRRPCADPAWLYTKIQLSDEQLQQLQNQLDQKLLEKDFQDKFKKSESNTIKERKKVIL